MENSSGGKSPFKKDGLFNEAGHLIFANAKALRKNMTDAENAVWGYIKGGIEGCKFRRQHPLGIYIADFYCHKVKLVVEIDGSIHNEPEVIEHDKIRQIDLENWGYKVIRFTNNQVMMNIELVIKEISNAVKDRKIL